MVLGSIGPSAVARLALCAAGGLTVSFADRMAVRAVAGPFDGGFRLEACTVAVVLYAAFTAGERLLSARRRQGAVDGIPSPLTRFAARAHASFDRFETLRAPVRLAVCTTFILVCWTPVIVMMAPGTIWYDTGDQIAQFLAVVSTDGTMGAVSSHHPLLDTIVFGTAAWAGEGLLGGYGVGLACYLAIQVAVTCTELAGVCLYARRVGCGRTGAACMLLFFAVFPAFPIFTMSIVKDTLHMMALIPWLVMVAETTRTRLAALDSRRFLIGFAVVSTLCALTTMTGLVIVILTLACLPLLRARRGRRLAALACMLVVTFVAGVAFPAMVRGPLRVRGEDANQLLVVPMQMTARYALDHPHDVTDRERRIIDKVNHVPFERMASRYNPYLADPVIQYSLRDPAAVPDYLRIWAAMGLRHPDSYAAAFAALESGWFSLRRTPLNTTNRGISLERLSRHADEATGNTMWFQIDDAISPSFRTLAKRSPRRAVDRPAAYRLWDTWRETPILNLPTFTAVWTFILPLFLAFSLIGRAGLRRERAASLPQASPRRSWWPFAIPLVWSLLSLLPNAISIPLKPTATRYMMWAPVTIALMLALLHADMTAPERLWADIDERGTACDTSDTGHGIGRTDA
ncbi:DUF6020 family protein [Bifidobacterium parmae]|uniref:Transmembrane protein n=1 Tax=Bifidobacterium parmae TaxID=361854 RepID=A0A2N5IX20_9BIFI|nr:DUF6020 family protein [Bifidobacterium parmae]PLS26505.1 hypothetical protein Uis4E_2080 [Bifidobacterium parmae]